MSDIDKDIRKLLEELEAQGARLVKKNAGYMIFPPGSGEPTMIHLTNSDHRAMKNAKARLGRAGFDV